MGLLPPLISYTTDASGFNMLKAQYGSAFFRASFQIGMTVTNELIAMSNNSIPVYFSLISNEASFNADCVANNYDGSLKAMYCVFLSNEAFDVNYILHEEYGETVNYNSSIRNSLTLRIGNHLYHSLIFFITGTHYTSSARLTYNQSGTGYYTDVHDTVLSAISDYGIIPADKFPITYRLTNCAAPTAPSEGAVGDTVTVTPIFPDGYGVINPTTDAYVMNNGVLVPSTWSNGVLTFTMPDPS